jgi:hypothetical protein
MGSRRSYSVSVVVGRARSLTPHKAQVTEAISRGDARDIAVKSAGLIAKSKETGDFFYGGLKLLEFLKPFESRARKLSAKVIDETLRKEWASIKKREKIRDDPAVDKAVLDAAKEVLQAKK